MKGAGFRATFVAMALLLSIEVAAQNEGSSKVIAVAVKSNDPRLQMMMPKLRNEASEVVEKSAKNARVITLSGSGASAVEQARQQSADYLLEIEITPRPSGSVPIMGRRGNDPTNTEQTPQYGAPTGLPHPERAEAEGAIRLDWTVRSLTGKELKLHDSRTVQEQEYPLGPQLDWLAKIASRSVRDAAAAAVNKLKSKKGL